MNCFSGGQFCREAGLFFLYRNVAGCCHEKQCCVFGGTLAIFASSSDFGTKRHKHIFIMEAEKIICCDGARNNDALAWAAMANKGNDRSNARISDTQILDTLKSKGTVKTFSEQFKAFTTGKSDISENAEGLFLCICFNEE